jgi:hypothetical protein
MGKVKQATGIDLNPVSAVQGLIKSAQNAPGINVLSKAATDVLQPVEKAVVQPVGKGLASFDKAVGNTIPGGWGTVGMAAASMIPGMQPIAMAGLGALNGSGVLRKGGSFNLQGAMMGGAMAYGMSSLAQYAQGAVPTDIPTVDAAGNLTAPPPNVMPQGDAISSLNASQGWTGAGASTPSAIPTSAINAANVANPATLASTDVGALNALTKSMEAGAGSGLQVAPQPSIASNIMGGNFGYAADQIGTGISNAASNIGNTASNAYDSLANLGEKAISPSTYTDAARGYGENVAKTGEGIKNLFGAGEMTASQASKLAAANAASQGLTSPGMAVGATLYGGMGLAALDEQRKYLEESKKANAISEAEYNSALSEINRSADVARKAVSDSPFSTNPDRSYTPTSNLYEEENADDNLYERLTGQNRLYAMGGQVSPTSDMDQYTPSYAVGGQIGNNPYANVTTADSPLEGMNVDNQNNGIKTMANVNPAGNAMMQSNPAYNSSIDQYNRVNGNSQESSSNGYPNAGLYGGSGSSGALPLEGQYGIVKMAVGGMPPRFLSGGGDGMSDSIPASINGKQEARLADGEFVIPADVVSHLGNGSSKAGAKQLYSMMDKVRSARTGTKQQGKQINPRKYLAA